MAAKAFRPDHDLGVDDVAWTVVPATGGESDKSASVMRDAIKYAKQLPRSDLVVWYRVAGIGAGSRYVEPGDPDLRQLVGVDSFHRQLVAL